MFINFSVQSGVSLSVSNLFPSLTEGDFLKSVFNGFPSSFYLSSRSHAKMICDILLIKINYYRDFFGGDTVFTDHLHNVLVELYKYTIS